MAPTTDPRQRAGEELLPRVYEALLEAIGNATKTKHISCPHCKASVRFQHADVAALANLWDKIVAHRWGKPTETVKIENTDGLTTSETALIRDAIRGSLRVRAGARALPSGADPEFRNGTDGHEPVTSDPPTSSDA